MARYRRLEEAQAGRLSAVIHRQLWLRGRDDERRHLERDGPVLNHERPQSPIGFFGELRELILVEEKSELMRKLGSKQLSLQLQEPIASLPLSLSGYTLELADDGSQIVYTYDATAGRTGITALLQDLSGAGIRFKDLQTRETSLEEIFVNLVRAQA